MRILAKFLFCFLQVASENKFQLYTSSNSTGKLKIDSSEYEFKAEDLLDLGEIGRGAFGTVNKMLFQKANKGIITDLC